MRRYLIPTALLALMLVSISQAAFADKGMLNIATEPGDAKIYINGKRKGNSPANKGQIFEIKLEEGKYKIEVIKVTGGAMDLYGENNDVFVAEDTSQSIILELKKRPSVSFRAKFAEKYAQELPIPKMINIPKGKFTMGCIAGKFCESSEQPIHRVEVSAFAMSATEVTFEQWDACVADGGCSHYPDDKGRGRGNRPVIHVSFEDVQEYLSWLNGKGKGMFQLPSEAQWEYAARAGSNTTFSWGNSIGRKNANCYRCGSQWDKEQTAPVASFKPNAFGLYDMHGNVWERTQDCWVNSYNGAGSSDEPRVTNECDRRVVRGGSWHDDPRDLRGASRSSNLDDDRYNNCGFRLSRKQGV